MDRPNTREPLETLHALNGLFLQFLQQCVRARRVPLDMPRAAARALGRVDSAALERIAAVPRALFRVSLVSVPEADERDLADTRLDQMQRSLRLTVLLTLWNAARDSACRARLFYGLDSETLQCLKAATLADISELAAQPRLLGCALADAEPFWTSLVALPTTRIEPELHLLALQPGIALSTKGVYAAARQAVI